MLRLIDQITLVVIAARRRGPLVGVRYLSRRSELVEFPVQAARAGDRLDVAVGRAAEKSWWRHFRRPAVAELLVDGLWRSAVGVVVAGDDEDAARARYAERFPRTPLDGGTRMVTFTLENDAA